MYSKKSTVIFVPRCGVASCLILPTSPCESGPLQPHKHYVLPCYPWVACHFEAELVLIYTNFAFVYCPCQTTMTFALIEAFWEKQTSSLHHAFSHYTPWPRPKNILPITLSSLLISAISRALCFLHLKIARLKKHSPLLLHQIKPLAPCSGDELNLSWTALICNWL